MVKILKDQILFEIQNKNFAALWQILFFDYKSKDWNQALKKDSLHVFVVSRRQRYPTPCLHQRIFYKKDMSVLDNGLKEKSIELIEKRLLYCHGTFFLPHLQFRLFQIKREKSELYLLVQEKSTASNKNVSWKSIKILNCCALIYSNFKIIYYCIII